MSVDKEIFDTHVIYGMYCTDWYSFLCLHNWIPSLLAHWIKDAFLFRPGDLHTTEKMWAWWIHLNKNWQWSVHLWSIL